jgi:hypothetical protein
MELDRAAAVLRPRRSWEGVDLGFTLARLWFPTLWLLWWLGILVLALPALALVGGQADWWLVLVWWFKPLYEAPLVFWSSRALFGEPVALRDVGVIFRSAWTRRLLPYLLWRRLSVSRSFNLPIVLLEGLHGTAVRRRRRVLIEGDGTPAWLTLICYHFEAILWGGLLLGLYFLIPAGLPDIDLAAAVTDEQSWPYWLSSACYLLAASVIAPFYICGGFALYIGRRTELEAWDLELAFRQAGSAGSTPRTGTPGRQGRRTGPGRPSTMTLVSTLLIALTVTWPGGGLQAATPATPWPDAAGARAIIAEVLADETFGRTRELTVWVPITGPDEAPTETPPWLRWLGELALLLGPLLKWLLISCAVAAVALLARRILRDWRPETRRRRQRSLVVGAASPATDFHQTPTDLAAAVRARLAAGDARGALALLYRGSIAHLSRCAVAIPEGATEGEVLRLAAYHLNASELAPLRHLTRDWEALAYARRAPDPDQITAHLAAWLRWTDTAAPTPDGADHGA